MKIVLVVASGVHTGKEIAVPGNQFTIGRDEGCNLRPASPAISKKHCAVYIKDGAPYVRDMGSTNGTFLNDDQIDGERPLSEGDRLKVGPLDFSVKLVGGKSDSTPLPNALRAVVAPATLTSPSPAPTPLKPVPIPSAVSKPPARASAGSQDDQDNDNMAAMLLSMDDDGPAEVPGGSTVMELPAVNAMGEPIKPDEKKKGIPTQADSSAIARDLLSRLTRRPR